MWVWPKWKKDKLERLLRGASLKWKEYGWGYEYRKRRARVDFGHSKKKKEHCPECNLEAIKEKWKFPRWKRKRVPYSMTRCVMCGSPMATYADRFECNDCGHVVLR